MELTKQIRFDLGDELYEDLNKICPEGNRAEFIRDALVEKLNRKKISQDEMYHRFKKIDKLDTESVRKTVVDVEFTAQVIYEEIKKQNEILKLIHRRSTLASGFSSGCFNQVKTEDEIKTTQVTLTKLIEDELNQLKF